MGKIRFAQNTDRDECENKYTVPCAVRKRVDKRGQHVRNGKYIFVEAEPASPPPQPDDPSLLLAGEIYYRIVLLFFFFLNLLIK